MPICRNQEVGREDRANQPRTKAKTVRNMRSKAKFVRKRVGKTVDVQRIQGQIVITYVKPTSKNCVLGEKESHQELMIGGARPTFGSKH